MSFCFGGLVLFFRMREQESAHRERERERKIASSCLDFFLGKSVKCEIAP